MIHHLARWLYYFFGMNSVDNPYYLFWSGAGGDVAVLGLVGAVVKGVFSVKKHLNKNHEQLKRHIDYKFDKQNTEATTDASTS